MSVRESDDMAETSLETPTIVFTEEAEAALRRAMMQHERRLRSNAVEFAVRARGTPAEITASDIQRAYNVIRNHPSRHSHSRRTSGTFLVDPRFFSEAEAVRRDRKSAEPKSV